MHHENCWVWFKSSLSRKGFWQTGFTCTRDEKPGVLIQSPSYVSCRVPEWRIKTQEPIDLDQGPEIPQGSPWKLPL